jgi:hypothetical protein
MPRLFRLAGSKASPLQEASFASRDALRKVLEENLPAVLEVAYLDSNFRLIDLPPGAPPEVREIDTLAFDTHTFAPVAIEYRERVTVETASQGVAILRALPTQSQIVKYLVKRAGFNPERLEWNRMRVLFIGREVTAPASVASRAVRGGIELWQAALHTGDILMLDHVATFPATEPPAPGASPSHTQEAAADDLSL